MKLITGILLLAMFCATAQSQVIYYTDKETFFSPQQLYFPGMRLPQKGSLNIFLLYEVGAGSYFDENNKNKIADYDIQNKRVMLSYSMLSNFQMYIGRSMSNTAYDLNNSDGTLVKGYNSVLDFLLKSYLPATQYNLLFPVGYNAILHPDRDRKDNLFGFTFRIKEFPRYKVRTYFDYFMEDREYGGQYYALKYGIPPLPQTFIDMFKQVEDSCYRFLVSKELNDRVDAYVGYENKRRKTSMHDGSYDDFHDYQTYLLKLTGEWEELKASAAMKKDGIGLSLEYQNEELFGLEISYRSTETPVQDESNYFTSSYGQYMGILGIKAGGLNFTEKEELISIAITQNF
ncbi:MAG: hypothetical protein PHQ23_00390 [Candidatus Wallbacteria bacterium]|nr:hypothetical protein [Candidatus Wallbacteria bacterium]